MVLVHMLKILCWYFTKVINQQQLHSISIVTEDFKSLRLSPNFSETDKSICLEICHMWFLSIRVFVYNSLLTIITQTFSWMCFRLTGHCVNTFRRIWIRNHRFLCNKFYCPFYKCVKINIMTNRVFIRNVFLCIKPPSNIFTGHILP